MTRPKPLTPEEIERMYRRFSSTAGFDCDNTSKYFGQKPCGECGQAQTGNKDS